MEELKLIESEEGQDAEKVRDSPDAKGDFDVEKSNFENSNIKVPETLHEKSTGRRN